MDKNRNFDAGDDAEKAAEMETLKTAMQEQLARFRPPFTPSNSLLLQEPPAIKVTRPPAASSEQLAEEEEANQLEEEATELFAPSETTMPRPHQPQPFPLPLRRRSSTSTTPSPNNSPAYRHSIPRLSITSLGSMAKTFRTLAAFIVPEVEADRERMRELNRASQRRASVAALKSVATFNGNGGSAKNVPSVTVDAGMQQPTRRRPQSQRMADYKGGEGGREEEGIVRVANSKSNSGISLIMRSNSARPVPRTTSSASQLQNSQRPTPLPRQQQNAGGGGGGQQLRRQPPQPSREASRSSQSGTGFGSAAGQHLQQNGGRTPSMPPTPRIVNKRYAHVKSKVASITDYQAAPSDVKIFHQPIKVSASPKVGSLQNASHVPAGGNVKIENRKLNFRESAKPRVEAKSEVEIPKSDVKIPTKKLVWNAESKVGSLEKATHKPGGGSVQIFNEPVKVKAESKVGSRDNIGHVPGGGNVKISEYALSPSGTGSVRSNSRRDTVDSGRSSSVASGHHNNNNNNSGKANHHKQGEDKSPETPAREPVEIVITPRDLPERHWENSNGVPDNHHEGGGAVDEGELINFGQ